MDRNCALYMAYRVVISVEIDKRLADRFKRLQTARIEIECLTRRSLRIDKSTAGAVKAVKV